MPALVDDYQPRTLDLPVEPESERERNKPVLSAPDDQRRPYDRLQLPVEHIFVARHGIHEAVDRIAVADGDPLGESRGFGVSTLVKARIVERQRPQPTDIVAAAE